jgi:hypothetical protein
MQDQIAHPHSHPIRAQPSLLRLSAAQRVAGAVVLAALLWAAVLWATG